MTDRTSISVSVDLKSELDSLKTHEQQSYEHLLWELIGDNVVSGGTETQESGTVQLEATEYQKIAEEVSEALR